MKVGISLIIKNENEYLQEWLDYHKSRGFDVFYIYDNESDVPVSKYIQDNNIEGNIIVQLWKDNKIGSQMRAYLDCCKRTDCDYILFIDTDEFYVSNTANVKVDIERLNQKYGKIDGIGLYWRMYGSNPPFETRQPISAYNQYHKHSHIKSILNPKAVISFPDPHKATIKGEYIDENGREIYSPIGKHTSSKMWIKHIWTRSLEEFKEKLERGSGDKVKRPYTLQHFYDYNLQCS